MTKTLSFRSALAAAGLTAGLAAAFTGQGAAASEGQIIHLTQTACQFIESENGVDHGFTSGEKADCEAINAKTGTERLGEAQVLKLKPGKYTFRVTNTDVPYQLGFWLRGEGLLSRATLPSVSGGGLTQGASKDYVIDLKPGEYLYSCPLNSTPDYKLVVEG